MLRFLYQSKYDDTRPTAAITKALCTAESDGRGGIKFSPPVKLREEAMVVNVKVYVLADKYNIPLLKQHARAKYKEILGQLLAAPLASSAFGDVEFECSVHCLQVNQ